MSDVRELRGAHSSGGVAAARAALIAWVESAGDSGRTFLQVLIRAEPTGRYSLRHVADAALPVERLEPTADPFAARAIAQTDAAGEHRPLKTSPNLRRGWLITDLDERGLWTALDYLYPACSTHWQAGRQGSLRVTHWSEVAARQTGIYGAVGLLKGEALRRAVRACCAASVCLRRVAWGASPAQPEALPTEPAGTLAPVQGDGDAEVPCPEACSMFISFARKVIAVERDSRRPLHGLGMLTEEELLQLRAVALAAAEATLGTVREGEFDDPLNRRRIRYLAERLTSEE